MGSLMAGWNSPRLRSKRGPLDRPPSMTKEEIELFWKTHKEDGAVTEAAGELAQQKNKTLERRNTFSAGSSSCGTEAIGRTEVKNMQRLHSLGNVLEGRTDSSNTSPIVYTFEKKKKIYDFPPWWTLTDYAYLNERPVDWVDGKQTQTYIAQH